jgi:beta-phosphoglucomutase-like phosphatase (HAD superfamily)
LGVASNSVKDSVELMMDKSHLAPWLDIKLSNQDVKKPKPAPDIYLKAAELLKVAPSECLVIEDNQHGIAAAEAAGTHVLAVSGIDDVTYQAIRARISQLEQAS